MRDANRDSAAHDVWRLTTEVAGDTRLGGGPRPTAGGPAPGTGAPPGPRPRRPPRRLLPPPDLEPRRRPRRPTRARRAMGVALGALSALVLLVSVIGFAAFHRFDSAVTREAGWGVGGSKELPGVLNVLLLGDDSRAGTGAQYGRVDGDRSDTTIIAHFAADGSLTLLSLPRDLLVTVVPRVRGLPADGRTKLSEVMNLAGVPGLITTVQALTGLTIDHTVSIDLAGFRAMTDAVGGVTVCVTRLPDGSTRNLNDQWSQWHGHLGENTLDGEQALAFVRTRHALGDERLRILRQQQFLSKLLAKATSGDVLTNPVRVTQLLGAVGGSLRVDDALGERELVALANRLASLGPGKLTFVTVPTHVPTRAEGAVDDRGTLPTHREVLLLDTAEFTSLITPLRTGGATRAAAPGPITASPAPVVAAGPTLAPRAVRVAAVRNATARSGLAALTAAYLRERGFTGAMAVGNASARATSEVHYPARGSSDDLAAARTLAAVVPGARLVSDQRLTDGVELVLGTSFTALATPGGATASPATVAATARATAPPPADTSCTP